MGIKQLTFLDYDGFCAKFEAKKTTDDCYTPENVYNAVRDWAVKEYGLNGREIVRPFWPGGDYEAHDYPAGCVVLDNPPFSILSKIVKWYGAQKIDYFLFAPYLTNFSSQNCNHVIAPYSVTYENGAKVDTSFVTNLGDTFIRAAPDLMDAVAAADAENRKATVKALPKYRYPDAVISSASIGYLAKHHIEFRLDRRDCAFIRKLDAQGGSGIYGGGFLLSERAAAERAAAERAAAERAAAIEWELSPREIAIQKLLGRDTSPRNPVDPANPV